MFRDEIEISTAWIAGAYVEGDDDAGRVVLGQLDGGAEEAVEVVVRGHEPGTCAERTAAGRLSQRPYARLERGHGARGSRVRAEVKGKGGGKGWEEEDAPAPAPRTGAAVEQEADAPVVGGADEVAVAEQRREPLVEGCGRHEGGGGHSR